MTKLLLVPYDSSMRIGDGYNSFLHTPCLGKVIQTIPSNVTSPAGAPQPSMPQIVSYNARHVKHLSDLVQLMNISPASVIQHGSLKPHGHFTSINESAFNDSDLNVVVSVSVMNQNNKSKEIVAFSPPTEGLLPIVDPSITAVRFVELYGDSYVSGFVEGGEFLGIVSVKILDHSNKNSILKTLKGKINSIASETLPGDKPVDFNSILEQTQMTIMVNWSGGGQIKPPNEQWSLNNIFQVAAGFSVKVAECPTNTWAILTRYDENMSFADWAQESGVVLPQFDILHQYTSDLLQIYMDYKSHIALLQAVVSRPRDYKQSTSMKPVVITTKGLLEAKAGIRSEMKKIVDEVNMIGRNPKCDKSYVIPPELWTASLPTLKNAVYPKQIAILSDVIRPHGPVVPRGAPRTDTFELSYNNVSTVKCGPGFLAKPGDLLIGMTYLQLSAGLNGINFQIISSVEKSNYMFRLDAGRRDSGQVTCTFLNPSLCGPGFQWGTISPQTRTTINNIRFTNRFTDKPHVVVWIRGLDLGHESKSTAKVSASRVTSSGFTLEADGWTGRQSPDKQVTWVAIPQSTSIKTGTILFGKGHPQDSDIAFSNDSEVFMAVNMFRCSSPQSVFNVLPKYRGDDEWCITSPAGVADDDAVGVSYIMFSASDE